MSFFRTLTPQEWAVPGYIILMIVERISFRLMPDPAQRGYTLKDSTTSISMGAGSLVWDFALGLATGLVTAWASHVSPWHLDAGNWVVWLSVFLGWDFCYYWSHRASHEIRILWAAHVVHHSSQYFNLSTALRQSWTGESTFMFYLPLAFFGADLKLIATVGGVNLIYQFWIHTERIRKLPRPVEFVMNTPSHHRVHHATNPQYLDRNYAGILILWDRIFGTFEPEVEAPRYGLTTNIETYNPLWVAFHEYIAIGRDLRFSRTWSERLGYVFRHPGWRPATSGSPITQVAAAS